MRRTFETTKGTQLHWYRKFKVMTIFVSGNPKVKGRNKYQLDNFQPVLGIFAALWPSLLSFNNLIQGISNMSGKV